MASTARSGFPARTNSRLDAFLRRHLAPEVYDAVRAYEPCIVLSDAEKYTFKYVVLSDRLIYLTENPPKSIRRVVALRDVVAIDLVRSARAGGRAGCLLSSCIPLLHQRKEGHPPHPAHDHPTSYCQWKQLRGEAGDGGKIANNDVPPFSPCLPPESHIGPEIDNSRPSVETRLQVSLSFIKHLACAGVWEEREPTPAQTNSTSCRVLFTF